jgi:hypothetical protein
LLRGIDYEYKNYFDELFQSSGLKVAFKAGDDSGVVLAMLVMGITLPLNAPARPFQTTPGAYQPGHFEFTLASQAVQ